jgi:hypothetical protein
VKPGIVALALLAGLGGCYKPVPDPYYTPCDAIASSDWEARLVDLPRADRPERTQPRLVVRGRVTVPTGGYRVTLEPGPVQRLDPPVQQVILRTAAPPGGATQAATAHAVQAVLAPERGVERVAIRCGDGTLALIPEIGREANDVRS